MQREIAHFPLKLGKDAQFILENRRKEEGGGRVGARGSSSRSCDFSSGGLAVIFDRLWMGGNIISVVVDIIIAIDVIIGKGVVY